MTTTLLAAFTKRLKTICESRGVTCGRWSDASPSSANVLAIGTKPNETFLYIKCRTNPPGFWGLTANRIAELDRSGTPWYAVLIVGSHETGYVAAQAEVASRISSRAWLLAADGDYKVNEQRELVGISRFKSFEGFLSLALPSLRDAA
nr:hypothetical protein [Nitrosomonas nitrosa]